MPKLYLANVSKHNMQFHYRLPEVSGPKYQDIPVGQQRQIAGELTLEEIDFIVKNASAYGLRKASDISQRRGYVGYVYAIGEPVKLDEFYAAYETNDDAMRRTSDERLQKSAAAAAKHVETILGRPVDRAEFETIEETGPGGTPHVARGIEVTGPGVAPRHRAAERRRSGRRTQ